MHFRYLHPHNLNVTSMAGGFMPMVVVKIQNKALFVGRHCSSGLSETLFLTSKAHASEDFQMQQFLEVMLNVATLL
jgi:hypothetical protein